MEKIKKDKIMRQEGKRFHDEKENREKMKKGDNGRIILYSKPRHKTSINPHKKREKKVF